jgi:hypothetical protein
MKKSFGCHRALRTCDPLGRFGAALRPQKIGNFPADRFLLPISARISTNQFTLDSGLISSSTISTNLA